MKALICTEWRIALLVVASSCAGNLGNVEDYQAEPVREVDFTRNTEAGRAPASSGQGGWGGSKAASAGTGGAGGWRAPAAGAPMAGSGASEPVTDKDNEDAGVADADSAQPTCDFRALMQAKCGNATCHGGPDSGSGLDLTSAMLAARVEGREGKGTCDDKLLVDPDNPRDSKLYLKVSGSTCGSQMPLGGQLNAEEQACVLTWIEGL